MLKLGWLPVAYVHTTFSENRLGGSYDEVGPTLYGRLLSIPSSLQEESILACLNIR
jgi:hypothetical protein